MAQHRRDLGVQGTLERNEPKRILELIGFPPEKNPKVADVLCLVEWWPSPDDPLAKVENSEIPYKDMREKAPRLLTEFYISNS